MEKNFTFLFVVKSRVDLDNYLPMISIINDIENIDVSLLVLDFHTKKIQSSFNNTILSKVDVRTLYSLTKKNFYIALTYNIYKLLMLVNVNFLNKEISFIQNFFYRVLCFFVKNNNKFALDLNFNCFITHPNIYNAMQFDKYPGSQFLFTKISNKKILKVCMEETFNQFNEVKEFSNVSNKLEAFCDMFLSNTPPRDNLNLSNKIPFKKILHIGSPRYSKFWCTKIDTHYAKKNFELGKKNINILYLPNKLSDGMPELTLLDLKKQNQVILKILELNKKLKIQIKTHPKSSLTFFQNIFQKQNNYKFNNVEFLPSSDDTSLYLQNADIVIAPGTSYIPHCLWAEKSVILLDEWCTQQGYTFTYENLCYGMDDFNNLIEKLMKKELLQDKEISRKLSSSFECGIKSDLYINFLQNKVKLLVEKSEF